MKVKYKLSESSNCQYVVTTKGINIGINIINGKLCLFAIGGRDNQPLSTVESAFASIRGFFAHKKNMDKLLSLGNKIHIFSSPFRGGYFYGGDVSSECGVPAPILRTCSR